MTAPGAVAAPPAVAARLAVVLLALAVAAVAVAHALRPDVGVRTDRLSELAVGSYAPVMVAAFLLLGAGLLALAVAVAADGGPATRAVAALLVVGGVGMILAGVWPTDLLGTRPKAGDIHSRASAAATVAVIAAALIRSVVVPPSRPRARLDAALALLGALLGILGPPLHKSAVTGFSQRALWLVLVAWALVVALRLAAPRLHLTPDRF